MELHNDRAAMDLDTGFGMACQPDVRSIGLDTGVSGTVSALCQFLHHAVCTAMGLLAWNRASGVKRKREQGSGESQADLAEVVPTRAEIFVGRYPPGFFLKNMILWDLDRNAAKERI